MTVATQGPTASPITANTAAGAAGTGESSGVAANTAKAKASIGQTYSQFLTLLTTQLRNQDPLSPMDSSQFTNQLVLFSQVEQQINANTTLGNIFESLQGFQAMQAQNYLGNIVATSSNQFALNDNNPSPHIGYSFASPPSSVDIQIYNSSGSLVAELAGGGGSASGNAAWDGKDRNGKLLPNGVYAVKVSGTFNGQQQPAESVTTGGLVTNVKTDPTHGTQLEINGSRWIPVNSIVSVLATPALTSAAQTNKNLTSINNALTKIQSSLTPAAINKSP